MPPDVTQKFCIWFFDDSTSVEDALITSANVESYDYRIDFQVTADLVDVQITRNEFDFRGEEQVVYTEAGFDELEQAYLQGKKKEESFTIEEIGEKENFIGDFEGLSSKMCKLIFRRSYDRHIYYLKLNQRVAPHHFYKPHIKVTYHALSGTGNR